MVRRGVKRFESHSMYVLTSLISNFIITFQSIFKLMHFGRFQLKHFQYFQYIGNSRSFFYNSAWRSAIQLWSWEPLEVSRKLSTCRQFSLRACNRVLRPAIPPDCLQWWWLSRPPYCLMPWVNIYISASINTFSIRGETARDCGTICTRLG